MHIHVLTRCLVAVWLMKVSFSFEVAIEVMTELVSQHQVSYVLLSRATLFLTASLHWSSLFLTASLHWSS